MLVSPSHVLTDGSIFANRYEIIKLLGKGGMGSVYEAKHRETDARVALKVIHAKEFDDAVSERFRREARAAAAIESQHTVKVFDAGVDDTTKLAFIVMERLRGRDLATILKRRGALPEETALKIAAQACVGLMRAHELGIVHRDIKPANLFLTESDGEVCVKVLDFGIAKLKAESMQGEEVGLTQTGNLLGSPQYMSPEQAQGLRTIDHRTDVWSLGIVLYEMLTGQSPYVGRTTIGQLVLAICSAPPAPVETIASSIRPEVASLVKRALELSPDDRFVSVSELYAALRRLVPHRSIALSSIVDPEDLDPASSARARFSEATETEADTQKTNTETRASSVDPSAKTREASSATVHTLASGASETNHDASTTIRETRAAPKPPLKLPLAVAAGAIAVAAVFFLWRPRSGTSSGSADSNRLVMSASHAPAVPTTSSISATPANASTGIASAVEAARVDPSKPPRDRLGVVLFEPPQAKVWVNGQEAPANQGRLILSGAPGTTFSVTLRTGISEVTREVVMSDRGPIPDRIHLPRATSAAPMKASAAPTGEAIRTQR